MHIDIEKRIVSLSVGEFANFSNLPNQSGKSIRGKWRAHLGQVWHEELRKQIEEKSTPAQFEVPIQGTIQHQGWQFLLNGRIDQLLTHNEETLIREIKTVTCPLPLTDEELSEKYPAYFLQLTAYQVLYTLASETTSENIPAGELLFVEISSGFTQAIANIEKIEEAFHQQIGVIFQYVEQRRKGLERLRNLTFKPAFSVPREGQEKTHHQLSQATDAKYLFFDAPTGF